MKGEALLPLTLRGVTFGGKWHGIFGAIWRVA
jgi:hypothetical protein